MSPSNSTGSVLAQVADLTMEHESLHKALFDLTQASAGMLGTDGTAQMAWNRAAALLQQLADKANN